MLRAVQTRRCTAGLGRQRGPRAAKERLEASISCLRKHGLRAHGMLGDADPVQAIADVMYAFPAEEIVICLEEPEGALASQRRDRADEERFRLPVTEIASRRGN